jgi:hypothetical protein
LMVYDRSPANTLMIPQKQRFSYWFWNGWPSIRNFRV